MNVFCFFYIKNFKQCPNLTEKKSLKATNTSISIIQNKKKKITTKVSTTTTTIIKLIFKILKHQIFFILNAIFI
jgi:hypothetical protein